MLNGNAMPTFATFIRNTGPGSVGGIPGISLPVGMTKAGLPVGMELSGPPASDHRSARHRRRDRAIIAQAARAAGARLEHDPEKWRPVFGKDHAQTKS